MNRFERACQHLKCNACEKRTLEHHAPQSALVCSSCGTRYPIVDNVVRFVPDDAYVGNFSKQWEMDAPLDPWSVPEFIQQTGIVPQEWRGKIIVDAGCGKGKSETYISRFIDDAAFVIAFDLSSGVERAAKRFAAHENIVFVQARFEEAPIPNESVDIVLAKGTLMHSPDLVRSFDAMARLVKLGGKCAVELYPSDAGFNWERRWRRITRHLSTPANVALTWFLANVLYHLRRIPLLRRLLHFFPVLFDRNPDQRFANTFDVISPRYAWRVPGNLVDYLYRKNGFRIERFLTTSVDAIGERIHPLGALPPSSIYFEPRIRSDETNQILYLEYNQTALAPGDEIFGFTPGFRHVRKHLDH